MSKINTCEIFGIKVANISYDELVKYIKETIDDNRKRILTYVTAHSLNIIYKNSEIKKLFKEFNVIHPDGIGTFIAIRVLCGKEYINKKITGSDFYPMLIEEAIRYKWRIYFWGDRTNVLERIQPQNEGIEICGYSEGYNINATEIVQDINMSNADILIVGMGCPLQERWIIQVKEKINVKVILAVGDGIKIFANQRDRNLQLVRKFEIEWLYRLLQEPGRLWRRYLIGIPLFLFRLSRLRLLKNL
ncbi:MAG: WecB/TagA/CpsF family glycosyltransferase [Promethearchaeota archaeon]|jgi:N-acetylglucosaminyldiphosphoundecaprenol N-acetyl-beta-D-mannosaminyltransferase